MQTRLVNFKRPLYIWNLMIKNSTASGHFTETLNLFSSMHKSNVHGNDFTYPLVIKACSITNSIRFGTSLHSQTFQLGFESNVFIQTSLIDLYSKASNFTASKKVFDEMPDRNLVSWNSLVSAYCRCFLVKEAILMLNEMRVLGFELSSATFIGFFAACELTHGLPIHCCVFKLGVIEELPLSNAIMNMYVRHGLVCEARTIFDALQEKSIVSWTTLINGYVDIKDVAEAICAFNLMRRSVSPDSIAFIGLITGSAEGGNLLVASSVHSLIFKSGFDDEEPIDNLLVSMYSKCGDISSARKVFDMVTEKSIVLWTSMIYGYTHLGYSAEALDLFKKLLKTGITPERATASTVLSACADLGILSLGKEIEEYISVNFLELDRQVQTSLIHMFSKCGSIEKAKAVFERVANKDLATWSSMINGYAIHGMAKEALSLFPQMQKEGIRPDSATYTSVLLACSHSGLVEEGMQYFQSMQKDFGIEPSIEHYTCLVDLLGRSGKLNLAYKTIEEMPFKVQGQAWHAFLSACRKHRNVEMAELAARKLSDRNHDSAGSYVLMANLYTSVGRWNEAAKTRGLIDERRWVKEPGWSQIEVNGSVHVFTAGDRYHSQSSDIYKKMEELNAKLLEAGYIPRTDTAIHDLEKEDKAATLKVHSERLAIAFGLISTAEGTSLTIIKNLRTCDDCHSALKIISKITGRHLIIRDGHRFHHFKSGSCSCKDFW